MKLPTQILKDSTKGRIESNLRSSLVTMRAFLDDAEREINYYSKRDEIHLAIDKVNHCFAWGAANSHSSIQNAMCALMDQLEFLRLDLEEAGKCEDS